MSSGASAAYEKPRSGRSICIDETPRSKRIASARTPLSASCSSTTAKSPRRNRPLTPVCLRKRSKYVRALGSRSIAISRPSPRRSAASSAAWPPEPKVASTTVSPGCTASSCRTSSASTGTWSVAPGCKTFGNILSTPFDLVQVLAPGGTVPDLEVVADPRHDDLLPQPGVVAERRRHHHPALLVELRLGRAREEVALHQATLSAERVELAKPRFDRRGPLVTRVGGETPLDPSGQNDAVGKCLTELGREREAVLVIDRVLVLAYQHG